MKEIPTDLKKLMTQINKKYQRKEDRPVTMFMTEDFDFAIDTFTTGSLMLDLALGRGGIPRGYIIELFGENMSGKTTLCMLSIASFQREEEKRSEENLDYQERYALFVDAEQTFDIKLAREYGVNTDKLIYSRPLTAEEAIDTASAYIESGHVGLCAIDSVPALVPSKIAESSIEQITMGELARFMGKTMQKLVGPSKLNETTIMFVNQVREKIGVMYGNPMTTPGGKALPFYSSVRLHVKAGEKIKIKDEVIGHNMKVRVIKNKFAIPFKEAEFPLLYGVGVDHIHEVSQLAIIAELVRTAGAWIRYEDEEGNLRVIEGQEMKFQGRAKFIEALRENKTLLNELDSRLRGIDIEAPDTEILDADKTEENMQFGS